MIIGKLLRFKIKIQKDTLKIEFIYFSFKAPNNSFIEKQRKILK